MALPRELQRELFGYLPFNRLAEQTRAWPLIVWQTWLFKRYGLNSANLARLQTPELSNLETCRKAAFWAGESWHDATNYLPAFFALVDAARQPNHAIFLDILLRNPGAERYVSDVVIQQCMRGDATAAEKLAWLFRHDVYFDVRYIIESVIAGYRLDAVSTAVFAASWRNFAADEGSIFHRRSFFAGYFTTADVNNITTSGLTATNFSLFDFLCGYACTHQLDMLTLLGLNLPSTMGLEPMLTQVACLFNLPGATDDFLILSYMAEAALRILPRGRTFPAGDVLPLLMYPATMQKRAALLLPLLPQYYLASTALDEFLAVLKFIVRPRRNALQIPAYLSIVFTVVSGPAVLIDNYALTFTQNPTLLLQQLRQTQQLTVRLFRDIATTPLTKVARLPTILAIPTIPQHYNYFSLESFRRQIKAVIAKPLEVDNSFLLQSELSQLRNVRVLSHHVVMTAMAGQQIFSAVPNNYVALTWRNFGLVVELDADTTKKEAAAAQTILELLALIIAPM